MRTRLFYLPSLLVLFLSPASVFAHQPRIVEQSPITVTDPEISKAYYGELTGEQQIYKISSDKPFNLYVGILEPEISGQTKNTSVMIIKADSPDSKPYAVLDGMSFKWTRMWEPFGADSYWTGPEYKGRAKAGDYEIHVLNTMNRGKYTLTIGETEAFGPKEIWDTLKIVPTLKRDFFEESPLTFILSPFGWGLILTLYALVLIIGLLAHYIFRRISKRSRQKGVTRLAAEHRLLLAGFGVCLLLLAVATSWNPILIFVSGVCLFEASGMAR